MDLLTRGPKEHRDVPPASPSDRPRGRIGVAIAAVVLLGVVGVFIAAYVYDQTHSDRVLPGVHVGGVDVGGMTRLDARRALSSSTGLLPSAPLVVHAGEQSLRVDPRDLGVRVDDKRAVEKAAAVADRLGFLSRLYHRFIPLEVSIPVPFTGGEPEVSAFVDEVAADVERTPVDAALEPSPNDLRLVKQRARPGLEVDRSRSVGILLHALGQRRSTVTLPTRTVPPDVQQPATTITIDLSKNALRLWDGFRAVRSYPVGTAQKGFRTPTGTWTVEEKVKRPDWTNPDPSGWGSDMPRHIPPGPKNPLGLRALYLNVPGIAIHGTPEPWTVGSYVSHGCVRMEPHAVERLFNAIPVGTPVVIYGSPPWGTKGGNGVAGV